MTLPNRTEPLRPDQRFIVDYITPKTSVMDIGCGTGELLHALEQEKKVYGHGIEKSSQSVAEALAKGLMVVQGDGDNELPYYPDQAFDYSILALSLQAMKQPKAVLKESLRIAKQCIVVIPNFGYWKNRLHLGLKGTMPVTKTLSYQWYETPNIHFCTIKDFIALGKEIDAHCLTARSVSAGGRVHVLTPSRPFMSNIMHTHGVFVLEYSS